MSTEKQRVEAERWLKTADDDLDAARLLNRSSKYAHACFHAQQAAEKGVKAVWYYIDADPWGHSIRKLIEDLTTVDADVHQRMAAFLRDGTILDRFYIPTRYPNGLPEMTPEEAFNEEDADSCISCSENILAAASRIIRADKS